MTRIHMTKDTMSKVLCDFQRFKSTYPHKTPAEWTIKDLWFIFSHFKKDGSFTKIQDKPLLEAFNQMIADIDAGLHYSGPHSEIQCPDIRLEFTSIHDAMWKIVDDIKTRSSEFPLLEHTRLDGLYAARTNDFLDFAAARAHGPGKGLLRMHTRQMGDLAIPSLASCVAMCFICINSVSFQCGLYNQGSSLVQAMYARHCSPTHAHFNSNTMHVIMGEKIPVETVRIVGKIKDEKFTRDYTEDGKVVHFVMKKHDTSMKVCDKLRDCQADVNWHTYNQANTHTSTIDMGTAEDTDTRVCTQGIFREHFREELCGKYTEWFELTWSKPCIVECTAVSKAHAEAHAMALRYTATASIWNITNNPVLSFFNRTGTTLSNLMLSPTTMFGGFVNTITTAGANELTKPASEVLADWIKSAGSHDTDPVVNVWKKIHTRESDLTEVLVMVSWVFLAKNNAYVKSLSFLSAKSDGWFLVYVVRFFSHSTITTESIGDLAGAKKEAYRNWWVVSTVVSAMWSFDFVERWVRATLVSVIWIVPVTMLSLTHSLTLVTLRMAVFNISTGTSSWKKNTVTMTKYLVPKWMGSGNIFAKCSKTVGKYVCKIVCSNHALVVLQSVTTLAYYFIFVGDLLMLILATLNMFMTNRTLLMVCVLVLGALCRFKWRCAGTVTFLVLLFALPLYMYCSMPNEENYYLPRWWTDPSTTVFTGVSDDLAMYVHNLYYCGTLSCFGWSGGVLRAAGVVVIEERWRAWFKCPRRV